MDDDCRQIVIEKQSREVVDTYLNDLVVIVTGGRIRLTVEFRPTELDSSWCYN